MNTEMLTLDEYEAAVRRTWNESELQADTIRRAQGHGFLVAHFRAVKQQRRDGTTRYLTPVQADGAGFPDLVMVRGDTLVVAELKKAGQKPKPEQVEWLQRFAGVAGAIVRVWDTRTPVSEIEGVLEVQR